MATTPVSESTDGPVLSVINKRLRTLRKKLTRILQMEESLSQGKTLNKEQEETLRSKTHVAAAIDELEKLRVPLATAVTEEIALAVARHQQESSASTATPAKEQDDGAVVEDLLNLLYFGSMFDVKGQNDFTSTMLTRTHERGCCLTYDYVTDDESSGDLLSEKDLDLIAMLSGLMVSRPVDSSLSHKEALQRCVLNAKQWLLRSDHPIDSDPNVTYSGLKAKLNKIMASDYFTTTPEMKATVEMAAAAAGNYASFQVPVHEPMGPVSVPVHVEGLDEQYQLQKDEEASNFQGNETYDNQSSPVEESQKGEFGSENSTEVWSQTEVEEPQGESQNQKEMESKEQQNAPRRNFQNNPRGGRGAGGGRRGYYPNGRGSRGSSRGGGPYQNGRNQFYDHPGNHPGNFYPRSYYSNRGRGGRGGGGGGGNFYNNHGSGAQATTLPAES